MNNIELLVESVAHLARVKPKSVVFAKHEGIIVPKHQHPYFKSYVADEQFNYRGYTDLVAGPYNAKHNAQTWTNKLAETFLLYKVPHLVMYFRPENRELLSVRILSEMGEFRQTVERYFLK